MRTVYDSNGVPHSADSDEDADAMIEYCGYTDSPAIHRVAAGHPLPDHNPGGNEVQQPVVDEEEQ